MLQLITVAGLTPSSTLTSSLNRNDSEYPYIQYISFGATCACLTARGSRLDTIESR